MAGVEFARGELGSNFAAHRPDGADGRSVSPEPGRSLSRTDRAHRRQHRRHRATRRRRYAFDTVQLGSHVELTGGLRWDRFDVDYDVGRVDRRRRRRSSAPTRWLSWRAGAVYKPRPERQHLRRAAGTSFNPSAEGPVARGAPTSTSSPRRRATTRPARSGICCGQQLSATAALFRTDKTNARTPGVNPGDPPTVLAGQQRVSGVELGVSGRITPRWTAFAGYTHMRSDIDASNTPAEVDQRPRAHAASTRSIVWTTFDLPWRRRASAAARSTWTAVFRNATNTHRACRATGCSTPRRRTRVNTHLTLRVNAHNLADERVHRSRRRRALHPGPGPVR